MKQLSKIPILRVIFFTIQTIKFFIKTQIKFIITVFKCMCKYWKLFIASYVYINANSEEKNSNLEKNLESSQTNIIVAESHKEIKNFFFDRFITKITDFANFSEKIVVFLTSNIMTFIVFYSTYFFIKEKNPKIFINNSYTESERKKLIYFFLEQECNDSSFFKQSKEEQSIQVDLAIKIFNKMLKSDKTAERIGINYFFWDVEYISSTLKWMLFWRNLYIFERVFFSENSKQQAIWIVKQMLDFSRKYPYSKYSRYVCYDVAF